MSSRLDLRQRIAAGQGGFVLFGITPPRRASAPESLQRIADTTLARLRSLDLDGLVLYDIDDESDRTAQTRPFPYLPTVDPADFYAQYLTGWDKPVVVYRCVGKYAEADLGSWLRVQDSDRVLSVFVGASSRAKPVLTGLSRAHAVWRDLRPDLALGGVAIPERHSAGGEEHLKLIAKQTSGSTFFVTQVVYDVNATKNLVSDYHYACRQQGLAPVPIVFTLSVCGSVKTLKFLQWLGVSVPGWMQNELRHTDDTLAESYEQCRTTAEDLMAFCRRLDVSFGFNVESVSIRRAEIDASISLADHLRHQLG